MTSKELSFLLLLCITSRVLSLSCPGPCVRADCDPKFSQGCTAGLTREVCGCCDECAKDVGEVCGGPWGTSGTCGDGLTCRKDNNPNFPGPPGSDFNAEGICIKDTSNCDANGEPWFCTLDLYPKCGSNGVRYGSSCEFASAQCKNPELGEIPCDFPPPPAPTCVDGTSYKKDCNTCTCTNGFELCTQAFCPPTPPTPTCVEGTSWKQDCNTCFCTNGLEACTLQLCPPEPECERICPAIFSPVCGNDGVTYSNQCALSIASCKNPDIKFDYEGDCEPRCAAPGSGCANGLCKERCDYENGEYNSPFQSCGGSNCTCCVAAATCHGNGNPCEGVIGGTCRGVCEANEVEQGFCSTRLADVAQCLCCRKVAGNDREFTLGFERFILLDEHKGVTWQQARNLCQRSGYDLAEPQIDLTQLASYLLTNYGQTYYWLGGKGQGSNIAWLSGQVVSSGSPLWREAQQGFQSSTNFCMYLRDDGNPNPLGNYNCQDTTYLTPLCEANALPPAAPAAPPADVPIEIRFN